MIQNIPKTTLSYSSAASDVYKRQPQNHLFESQCKVLYIRGLDHPSLSLQALYNVFSNFGMVIRMLFFRQKGAMLIQYSNAQEAQQCKEWMNCVVFYGNSIRIFDSNHKEIKSKQQGINAGEFWERDYMCKERGKQANPPSEVVHVANLRPEVCQQDIIFQIFSMVGIVQNIKFLLEDPQKKMCLVKYQTIEESLNAIAFLHGYLLYGRQIQVSFTRSKI
eukprot:TRINITY_DN8390_c0_g1_i1.p2 TRINITY_DN8390_c0_g1~~TRINITY_DN8390_c0_g1_i1.p2  ORF type:complete len:220 (-),score=15.56 TRINITY_DN8390_c0_g1_i1:100-759(-)